MTHWRLSHRADPRAAALADRHYNRQAIGSAQFVPPGRCLVLLTPDAGALWVTSWPFADWTKHAWAGAWVNSLFRRESGPLASELILEALAITRWFAATEPTWRVEPEPELGMVTFIDLEEIRHKRDPGRCYRRAGFKVAGHTQGGLLALQILPAQMPAPAAPTGSQLPLFV